MDSIHTQFKFNGFNPYTSNTILVNTKRGIKQRISYRMKCRRDLFESFPNEMFIQLDFPILLHIATIRFW